MSPHKTNTQNSDFIEIGSDVFDFARETDVLRCANAWRAVDVQKTVVFGGLCYWFCAADSLWRRGGGGGVKNRRWESVFAAALREFVIFWRGGGGDPLFRTTMV